MITKSLFVEYINNPKLARRHTNDKNIYQNILTKFYAGIDGIAIGKTVEDMAKKLRKDKDIFDINLMKKDFKNRHQSFHKNTMEVVNNWDEILYQAWFCYNNLFCKTDFLIKNNEWTYDIIEVKSKNNIRKWNIEPHLSMELKADCSFQHYLVNKCLWKQFSGKIFLVYLNKDFVKKWEIFPQEILIKEDISNELFSKKEIERYIENMEQELCLNKNEFNKLYPYNGGDFISYFWKDIPEKSIWQIPGIWIKKADFFNKWKFFIDDLSSEDNIILLKNWEEETKSSRYLKLWNQWIKIIDKKIIQKEFEKLKYPLFFYDYETISSPIPLFDWTSPWQQAVVQYSLHKVEENGNITHKEYLIDHSTDTNKEIINQLVVDLEWGNGTYIVWFKWFENKRNEESATMYPEFRKALEKVNEHTFDLMEIFQNLHYFHRDFKGSASIKKVLPVLTEISYDNMEIGNWAIATGILANIQKWMIVWKELEAQKKNLLKYCEQDSRAMVRIWQEVVKEIK